MLDKIKKLLNVKAWFEDVLMSKVLTKGTVAATAAVVGLLSAPKVAPVVASLKPLFDSLGITPEQFATAAVAFAIGALGNWAKRVMNKDAAPADQKPA